MSGCFVGFGVDFYRDDAVFAMNQKVVITLLLIKMCFISHFYYIYVEIGGCVI